MRLPAFRVLIVWPDQWPRALLRAELRERGWDAIGATSLLTALRYPERDPERGPVRLMIVDASALESPILLERLRSHHPGCRTLLIAPAGQMPVFGYWDEVLHRPVSIGEVGDAVARLLGPETPRAGV